MSFLDETGLTELVAKVKVNFLKLTGGTMTGPITNSNTSGGTWLSGKTSTPKILDLTTACVNDGSRYDPLVRGKDADGNYWNFGQGANGNIGFYGYLSSRTANGTDWGYSIDIETGKMTLSGTATISGYSTTSHTHSYLPLSGGTVTGSVNLTSTQTANSTSNSQATGTTVIGFKGTNGAVAAYAYPSFPTSSWNYQGVNIRGDRIVSSSTYTNSIAAYVDGNGGKVYAVTYPAGFRGMLGLGYTSGAVPVANGGTGATAVGSTLLSNIGIYQGTSSPSTATARAGCIYVKYAA